MTTPELRRMDAGRELDAEVAEKVMGWINTSHGLWFDGHTHRGLPDFSARYDMAFAVVEKMADKGYSCVIATNECARTQNGCKFYEGWRGLGHHMFGDARCHEGHEAIAHTIPLAICEAALSAIAATAAASGGE